MLSEQYGDWFSGTCSAAGAVDGTTLVDTQLEEFSNDDDFCAGWWVRITSGNNDQEIRLVKRTSGYSQANTTITVTRPFTNQVATNVTYELHRLNPTYKLNALARASILSYPKLYLPIVDDTLIVDDQLSNTSFESFSSPDFTSWTRINSPTMTQETSIIFHLSNSAKMVSGGSAGSINQAPTLNIAELSGRTATFKRWVWSDTKDESRIQLKFGGSGANDADSAYHTGNDEWKLLSVSASIPTDATKVDCFCQVVANQTGYFDGGSGSGLFINRIHKYTIPTTILRGPHFVQQQYYEDRPDGPYYSLADYTTPQAGRILRLRGMGILAQPTTDNGTVEIGEPQVELFLAHASVWLYRTLMQRGSQQEREHLRLFRQDWEVDVHRLEIVRGIAMRPMGAEIPRGTWHVEEDSGGRYLIFN